MRSWVLSLAVLVGAVVACAHPAASEPAPVASAFYVVRPDPRLCPSPLCGGYWVALANRARTRCADGLLRPRCYVAKAVGRPGQSPPSLPAAGLAKGRLESMPFGDFGELGVLVVEDVYAAAGTTTPTGQFVRLVDTGIRCVRAPCYSILSSALNSLGRALVSGVALRAGLNGADTERAEAALRSRPDGLLAQGRIVPATDRGRTFVATRVFLRGAQPRA